jgi:porin
MGLQMNLLPRPLRGWPGLAGALLCAPAALAEEVGAPSPVSFSAAYTRDLWRDVSGGRKQGWASPDNLDLTMSVDAERALGWRDTTLFAYGLYNNGVDFSGPKVGDIQTISNIETGVGALRLYEAWAERRFAGGRASLRAGLYDLNSEFDVTTPAGLFLNASHGIGPEFAQSGQNGPSIFPVTSLAVRGEWKANKTTTVRAAVLDAVPGDPGHPKRTAIRLKRDEGALLVAEAEHATPRMTLSLGAWRYTNAAQDLLQTARAGSAVESKRNWGAYATIEGRLSPRHGDSDRGLAGWLRAGVAEARVNPLKGYLGGGLVYTGPAPGRDEDQLGLAVAAALFGEPYRRAQQLAGVRTKKAEVNIELSYRAPITPWLTVQPDIQYVINPGGEPDLRDAVVGGLRLEVAY